MLEVGVEIEIEIEIKVEGKDKLEVVVENFIIIFGI